MTIQDAKEVRIGESVLVNGCLSTVLNTMPLSADKVLFEVCNKYDGVIDVTHQEIELF
jgi:hypothetical protein